MNVHHSSQPVRAQQPAPHRGPLELAETHSLGSPTGKARGGTRFRRGVILGIFITVLLFLLLELLPDYLVKGIVLNRLRDELGQPVTAGRVSVSLLPRIRLSFFDVVSRSVDSSADLFHADRIDVMLRGFSWLSGGAAIEKLAMEAPSIVVRRDENGHWSIPVFAGMDQSQLAEARVPTPAVLPLTDLQVVKGTIRFIDDSRRGEARIRDIAGVQASMIVNQAAQRADLKISAFLPSTSQLSTISFVGVVTLPNSDGDSDPGLVNSLRLSGAVQGGGIDIRQVATLFLPRSDAGAFTGTAHIGAEFVLIPRRMGQELVVEFLWTRYGNDELCVDGGIETCDRAAITATGVGRLDSSGMADAHFRGQARCDVDPPRCDRHESGDGIVPA
jgi:hypothetical protein